MRRPTVLAVLSLVTALGLAPAVQAKPESDPPAGAAKPADPNRTQDEKRYRDCLERARSNPAKAREVAAQWEAVGGGAEAQHCGAIALIGLGAEGRAAMLLTQVGSGRGGGLSAADRAAALLLAGDIWLRLGRFDLADKSFGRAAKLSPKDPEALIGQAKAVAARKDYATAEKLLTGALKLKPQDPESLILRAAARRKQKDYEKALVDVETALKQQKGAPIGWFEKGAAEKALGRDKAAKESWLIASQLDPVGPVGDLARAGLQQMILGAK